MTERFHRPAALPLHIVDGIRGAADPAAAVRAAHESARIVVDRARGSRDPEVVDRLLGYTDEHGIDAIAELWAGASPHSLPGALWRVYLVRAFIVSDPDGVSLLFDRGVAVLPTADAAVVGAASPAGPSEIVELAGRILRGVFEGDLAIALHRAAAFCRIVAAGATSVADDQETPNPDAASVLTRRALRLTVTAEELAACARLWGSHALD